MVKEFERDDGTRGVQDKNGKIITNLPAKGGVPAPAAPSFTLVQDTIPGFEPDVSSGETKYGALHQKMVEAIGGPDGEFDQIEANLRSLGDTEKELKQMQSRVEYKQHEVYAQLRNKGAEIMNIHRPVYDATKITLENQNSWDAFCVCYSCQTAYPCFRYTEVKYALNSLSPEEVNEYLGSKVHHLLVDEALNEARDGVVQDFGNGLVRGMIIQSYSDEVGSIPVGTVIKLAKPTGESRFSDGWNPDLDQLDCFYVCTSNAKNFTGWGRLGRNSDWAIQATAFIKGKTFHKNDHLLKDYDVIIEGFLPN